MLIRLLDLLLIGVSAMIFLSSFLDGIKDKKTLSILAEKIIKKAKKEYEQATFLESEGVVPTQTLDDATRTLDATKAQLLSTEKFTDGKVL